MTDVQEGTRAEYIMKYQTSQAYVAKHKSLAKQVKVNAGTTKVSRLEIVRALYENRDGSGGLYLDN